MNLYQLLRNIIFHLLNSLNLIQLYFQNKQEITTTNLQSTSTTTNTTNLQSTNTTNLQSTSTTTSTTNLQSKIIDSTIIQINFPPWSNINQDYVQNFYKMNRYEALGQEITGLGT